MNRQERRLRESVKRKGKKINRKLQNMEAGRWIKIKDIQEHLTENLDM